MQQANYTTLANSVLTTGSTTLLTATNPTTVKKILAINADTSSHTVTLTLVRKGGTSSDAFAVTIATAYPVPASSVSDLTAGENLQSALDGLLMMAGDTIVGLASAGSEVTFLAFGH